MANQPVQPQQLAQEPASAAPPAATEQPADGVQPTEQHPVFGPGPVATISGENGIYQNPAGEYGHENMGRAIAAMGLSAEPSRGKYGANEPTWIVRGASIPQLQQLGQRFGQESVAVRMNNRNFFLYTLGPHQGQITRPVEGVEHYADEPKDYYTVLPGPGGRPNGYFQWNMDSENKVPVHQLDQYLNQTSPVQAAQAVLKSVVDTYHGILLDLRKRELSKAQMGEQVAPHREPGIHEPSGQPHQEPGIHERPAAMAPANPMEKSTMKSSKVFDLVKSQVEVAKANGGVMKAEPKPQDSAPKCDKCGRGHKTADHASVSLFEDPEPKPLHPSDKKKMKKDEQPATAVATTIEGAGGVEQPKTFDFPGRKVPDAKGSILAFLRSKQSGVMAPQPEQNIGGQAEASASAAAEQAGEKPEQSASAAPFEKQETNASKHARANGGRITIMKSEQSLLLVSMLKSELLPDAKGIKRVQMPGSGGQMSAGSKQPGKFGKGEKPAEQMPKCPGCGGDATRPQFPIHKDHWTCPKCKDPKTPSGRKEFRSEMKKAEKCSERSICQECSGNGRVHPGCDIKDCYATRNFNPGEKGVEACKKCNGTGLLEASKDVPEMKKADFGAAAAPGAVQPPKPQAPAPGGKPMAPPKPAALKPAGIPGAPKTPAAPGMTKSEMCRCGKPGCSKCEMQKSAMSMGAQGGRTPAEGAKNASFQEQVGTSTTGPVQKVTPRPPADFDAAAFRPASPGAGGVPAGQAPKSPSAPTGPAGKLPIASLTRITNVPRR